MVSKENKPNLTRNSTKLVAMVAALLVGLGLAFWVFHKEPAAQVHGDLSPTDIKQIKQAAIKTMHLRCVALFKYYIRTHDYKAAASCVRPYLTYKVREILVLQDGGVMVRMYDNDAEKGYTRAFYKQTNEWHASPSFF